MEIRLLNTKPLKIDDLRISRYTQMFYKHGLLDTMDKGTEMEWLTNIVKTHPQIECGFDHILDIPSVNMSPSDLYQHLLQRTDALPPFLITYYTKNGNIFAVEKPDSWKTIEDLIEVLETKGKLDMDLLGGETDDN